MAKLNPSRNESEILDDAIAHWESERLITPETANRLRDSYEAKGFDWKRLARYSFWIALVCGIVALASLVIDDKIIHMLERLYDTPDIVIAALSAGLSAWFFVRGSRQKKRYPEREFSNEALLFTGILFTASTIAFLGKSLNNWSGHFSWLFLVSVFVYAALALHFRSRLIWIFALISLGSWFGTETGYQTNWAWYFLGMNYPLRFTLFGIVIIALSRLIHMEKIPKLADFREVTYLSGLFYLFVSLWLLSVFGNFGSIADWLRVDQLKLFLWALLSAIVALGFMLYGLKFNDPLAREFGITFLIINIYTRYFEYFWDSLNKSLFFAILALSFWLIGRKAEKIWHLDFLDVGSRKVGESGSRESQKSGI
ncbi:MAG: DUF2157 domain-containing protein [Mucilaginibacter polytrichastri]|nr:DUF2157 domain-containing protein [Mucilaginibacter polytrichastri]